MAKYFLDTGIIVGYARKDDYASILESKYDVFKPPNIPFVSVVSLGEIQYLALKRKYGESSNQSLLKLLSNIPIINIFDKDRVLFQRFAEIQAFNRNQHPSKRMKAQSSAIHMNHNDIWIASKASLLNAKLLTTDKDFHHLNGEFLEVVYIDPHTKL